MAAVDIIVLSGHRTRLRWRNRNGAGEFVCECSCGWTGPAYPDNDEWTATDSLRIHRQKEKPLPPTYAACLSEGSGRADPADRLPLASPRAPEHWSWEEEPLWHWGEEKADRSEARPSK